MTETVECAARRVAARQPEPSGQDLRAAMSPFVGAQDLRPVVAKRVLYRRLARTSDAFVDVASPYASLEESWPWLEAKEGTGWSAWR